MAKNKQPHKRKGTNPALMKAQFNQALMVENQKAIDAGIRYGLLASKLVAMPIIGCEGGSHAIKEYIDGMIELAANIKQSNNILELKKLMEGSHVASCYAIDIEEMASFDDEIAKFFPKENR